ncbi:hypothetical protein Tco_0431860 [Tanacetum coccineum]
MTHWLTGDQPPLTGGPAVGTGGPPPLTGGPAVWSAVGHRDCQPSDHRGPWWSPGDGWQPCGKDHSGNVWQGMFKVAAAGQFESMTRVHKMRDSRDVRMTKVIKGEFEKIKDVKVEDVSLTCDTSLEVFNDKVNRLSGTDDDLFTYEVEITNIPYDSKMDDDSEHEADDDMGYDPSDVAFTEWLGSKFFNYKTMNHYTMKALWIYWIRGYDEVELTDDESSDDKDEVAKVIRIDTNLFNFETPMCEAYKEFNYLLQIDPDLVTKDIEGFKTYEDYKDDWIYEWNKDDYKLYEALEDSELKDEALRNKAIMERFINVDDDESRYEQKRRWNIYTNYDDAYEINHEDYEREELCKVHELPVCNIRKYMMIKYSFNNDEEYVAVKKTNTMILQSQEKRHVELTKKSFG